MKKLIFIIALALGANAVAQTTTHGTQYAFNTIETYDSIGEQVDILADGSIILCANDITVNTVINEHGAANDIEIDTYKVIATEEILKNFVYSVAEGKDTFNWVLDGDNTIKIKMIEMHIVGVEILFSDGTREKYIKK